MELKDIKKTALVMGAGGFIGSHLVKKLKKEGFWVRGVDLKYPEFSETLRNYRGEVKYSSMIKKLCEFNRRSEFILQVLKAITSA